MSLPRIFCCTVFAGALALATPVYAAETGGLPGGHGAAFGGPDQTTSSDDNGQLGEVAEGEALEQSEVDWLTAPPAADRLSVWIPTAEWTVALSLTIPLFLIDPSFVNTGKFSADTFAEAWTNAPVWDTDGAVANYVLHPMMGAEAYLTLRNREYGPLESFLFATGVSFAWEYLFEAWVENPSGQDLLVTSPAGALLGELRFQIRRRLTRWSPSLGRDALIVLVDPIEAIHRYIGKDDAAEETMNSALNFGPDQAQLMLTMQF
ncbi:MAG: DUF3943 domain-containing protein [Candidatus Binatia bacterium]